MEISVIIPVYNKVDYIDRCLESILTQDFSDFEIVAVDDGSTDGSATKLDTLAQHAGYFFLLAGGAIHSCRRGDSD